MIFPVVMGPLYKDDICGHMQQHVRNEIMPELIPTICLDAGIPQEHIVNVFEILGGKELRHPEWFPDNCHCNDNGYAQIGQEVFRIVKDALKEERESNNY